MKASHILLMFSAGMFLLIVMTSAFDLPTAIQQNEYDNAKHRDYVVFDTSCEQEIPAEELAEFTPFGCMRDEQTFNDYVVRMWRDHECWEAIFEILHRGTRVYAYMDAHAFWIENLWQEGPTTDSLTLMGNDITGNGIPNLVIAQWTGGAHGCYIFHVFEIGDDFRKIDEIHAMDTGYACFLDLDGDDNLEFWARDFSFAYWRTCFAASPAPEVMLRYCDGAYHLAVDFMRRVPPSEAEIKDIGQALKQNESWGNPPVALWYFMLEYIYTGNAHSAWELLDQAWPEHVPDKDEFKRDFLDQLSGSPYWTDLQELNSDTTRDKTIIVEPLLFILCEDESQWPLTASDAVDYILDAMTETEKHQLQSIPREELYRLLPSWGPVLIDTFGLEQSNGKLLNSCGSDGMNADSAAFVILFQTWTHLQQEMD